MRLWRISNYTDLSGRGGVLTVARWHLLGTPIVYCADHPATALLEYLVHVDLEDLPARFQLLEIGLPDDLTTPVAALPSDWKDNAAATRRIGSDFVNAAAAPAMQVPSVIVPFASNYLLNPALLQGAGICIVGTTVHLINPRLFRQAAAA